MLFACTIERVAGCVHDARLSVGLGEPCLVQGDFARVDAAYARGGSRRASRLLIGTG